MDALDLNSKMGHVHGQIAGSEGVLLSTTDLMARRVVIERTGLPTATSTTRPPMAVGAPPMPTSYPPTRSRFRATAWPKRMHFFRSVTGDGDVV